MLVAAFLHDADHSGHLGNDRKEIERALRFFDQYHDPIDRELSPDIHRLMGTTLFPHQKSADLPLDEQILRDADMVQGLDDAWIQQVVFGLSKEEGVSPLVVLERQEPFLRGLTFYTDWAREHFGPTVIEKRINEARELLAFLRNGNE